MRKSWIAPVLSEVRLLIVSSALIGLCGVRRKSGLPKVPTAGTSPLDAFSAAS